MLYIEGCVIDSLYCMDVITYPCNNPDAGLTNPYQ